MTRFLVCGAGAMAEGLVYDLLKFSNPDKIILADFDDERLGRFNQNGVEKLQGDLSDQAFLNSLFENADIACGAASYKLNLKLTETAIVTGKQFIDLGGNNSVVRAQLALSDQAARAGVSVIPDCGLAPGMVSILAADGISRFRKVDSVKIRVGGLPQKPEPPLEHALFFSVEGLLNEYREPTLVLRNGQLRTLDSLTELESLSFPPNFPELEAFHTSGGVSSLPFTYEGRVDHLDYKTIRYPGHLGKIKLLFDLGLADEAPIDLDGNKVSPDELLRHLLKQALPSEVPDVAIAYVEIVGEEQSGPAKATYYLEDYLNTSTGHTAMQRTTAYSAGIIMQMLAERSISTTGVLRLEQDVDSRRFLSLLAKRGFNLVCN